MKRALWVIIGVLVLAAAGLAAWLMLGIERPFKGYEAPEQFVEIPAGSGPASMGRRLEQAGVVRSAAEFRAAV